MKRIIILAAFAATVAQAATITGVTARQRWPWNSLIDVDFTVNGDAGEAYAIGLSATAAGGAKKLYASTFATEPIAASGRNTRLVWNFGADYPEFRADDLQITVTATPFSDSTPLYLVVDISGGSNAANYPVRYTTTAPVHTPGVEDPCKTTELWLKRVKAGTIQMGGSSGYAKHTCTLTNDYYLGVFSLTQAQCRNINGSYASNFTNGQYRATRPCDTITASALVSNFDRYPDIKTPSGGICKTLANRTGGLEFCLPTEWQWEFACRAGTTWSDERYPGMKCRYTENSIPSEDYEWYSLKEMWSADYGTSYVDAYDPNPWGFYGMIGNVWEWCANMKASVATGAELTEPEGPSTSGKTDAQKRTRACRGGQWASSYDYCRCCAMKTMDNWNTAAAQYGKFNTGARLCIVVKKRAE